MGGKTVFFLWGQWWWRWSWWGFDTKRHRGEDVCGEKLCLKCLSIQTLLSLLVGWNTPTEVFHNHHTKEENQRRETHLPGRTRLFSSTELSSQQKKKDIQKNNEKKNLTGAMVLSCLFTRCILCQCYFRVSVVHFVFLGKAVRVYLCGDCLFRGYDWHWISHGYEAPSHCTLSCQEAVKKIICVSCVLRNFVNKYLHLAWTHSLAHLFIVPLRQIEGAPLLTTGKLPLEAKWRWKMQFSKHSFFR